MPATLSSVPQTAQRILFVDDDADVRQAATLLLTRRGFSVSCARDPAEAWSILGAEPIDVVLLDLNFQPGSTSGAEGFACLERLVAHDPDLVVVVVTGHSGITIAVAAMRAGAADFVMKPWSNERLVSTLNDAAALARRRRDARTTSAPPTETTVLIGESPSMLRVLELMRRAAPTDAPILLLGEAGTGKSLLARTIHRLSKRAAHPFVTLDPAAPDLSSLDTQATLFLDDIDTWPPHAQKRLLDILPDHPGLRLLAATRLTRASLLATTLRPDLLYRLNTVELTLPPLRERGGDARLLAAHYLRLFARRYGRPALALSPEAANAIAAAFWTGPGTENVRALVQTIERAVVLAQQDLLGPNDIPLPSPLPDAVDPPPPGAGDLNLSRSEKAVVAAALSRHAFNVSQAAKELGLTRAALYRRMARHGL